MPVDAVAPTCARTRHAPWAWRPRPRWPPAPPGASTATIRAMAAAQLAPLQRVLAHPVHNSARPVIPRALTAAAVVACAAKVVVVSGVVAAHAVRAAGVCAGGGAGRGSVVSAAAAMVVAAAAAMMEVVGHIVRYRPGGVVLQRVAPRSMCDIAWLHAVDVALVFGPAALLLTVAGGMIGLSIGEAAALARADDALMAGLRAGHLTVSAYLDGFAAVRRAPPTSPCPSPLPPPPSAGGRRGWRAWAPEAVAAEVAAAQVVASHLWSAAGVVGRPVAASVADQARDVSMRCLLCAAVDVAEEGGAADAAVVARFEQYLAAARVGGAPTS